MQVIVKSQDPVVQFYWVILEVDQQPWFSFFFFLLELSSVNTLTQTQGAKLDLERTLKPNKTSEEVIEAAESPH